MTVQLVSQKTKLKLSAKDRLAALGYPNYISYLNSNHWMDLRRRYRASEVCRKNADGEIMCSYCNSTVRLTLRHKHYERLGDERLSDLHMLCREHYERNKARAKYWSNRNRKY